MEDQAYLEVDEKEATKGIWREINKVYSHVSHLVNFKYYLLLYRLVKKRYVKIKHLEEVTGFTKQRIYQIVNQFESREIERKNNE